ncbi:MAG: LTA synthase family protein, partial [Lachnospiraceae bacterium]|nr:LTA synthase family protein [Lachnospiraceae bacterium]
LRGSCYYSTTPPVIYTLPPVLISSSLSKSDKLTEETAEEVNEWLADQQALDSAYPIAQRDARKNLVVIFCESLESWLIGAKADGDKTLTPYINSLIADSATLYFPHVLSQVGSGRSIDAQLLMLAGMMPLQETVWSMRYPGHTYPSIPKAMHRRDSAARAVLLTADKPITWNQSLVAKAFEVDTMLSRDDWEMTEMVGSPAKLSDGAFLSQSVDKLKDGLWPEGTPAYLHFVTYSGHSPFRLQKKLRGIDISGKYPERMRDYMTMANYTDRSLQPLIDYLKSRSDWDDTMVVIVGDHEALGSDRAAWLKQEAASEILSPNMEVPLIILNSPIAGKIDKKIGQIDVYSTIIDLMGLRQDAWPGMGISAFSPMHASPDTGGEHQRKAREISADIIKYDLLKDKREENSDTIKK